MQPVLHGLALSIRRRKCIIIITYITVEAGLVRGVRRGSFRKKEKEKKQERGRGRKEEMQGSNKESQEEPEKRRNSSPADV